MRVLTAVVLLSLLSGCSSGGADPAENADAEREADSSYCVAYVRAHAFGGVEANRVEEGKAPEYQDPADSPTFQKFVAAAPAEVRDALEIMSRVPPPTREEIAAASEAADARLAKDCYVGEDAESPLSAECRARAVAVQRILTSGDEGTQGEIEAFGKECRPATDPYASLGDECVAIVYGHFTTPALDGVTSAGGPTHDEDQAISARFDKTCSN